MVSKCCPSPLRSSTCFFLKPQRRSFVAIEEAGGAVRLPLSAPPVPSSPPDLTHQGGPGRTDSVIPTSLPPPPGPTPVLHRGFRNV